MQEVSHILHPTQPSTRLPQPMTLSFEFHKVKLLLSSPTYLFILQVSAMHPPDNLVSPSFHKSKVLAFSFSFVYVCMILCLYVGQRLTLGVFLNCSLLIWLVQLASLPQGWLPVHLPSNGTRGKQPSLSPIYLGT